MFGTSGNSGEFEDSGESGGFGDSDDFLWFWLFFGMMLG